MPVSRNNDLRKHDFRPYCKVGEKKKKKLSFSLMVQESIDENEKKKTDFSEWVA